MYTLHAHTSDLVAIAGSYNNDLKNQHLKRYLKVNVNRS